MSILLALYECSIYSYTAEVVLINQYWSSRHTISPWYEYSQIIVEFITHFLYLCILHYQAKIRYYNLLKSEEVTPVLYCSFNFTFDLIHFTSSNDSSDKTIDLLYYCKLQVIYALCMHIQFISYNERNIYVIITHPSNSGTKYILYHIYSILLEVY